MANLVLPPNLSHLQAQAGKHRKGRKILVYGQSKTGKSFLGASAPGPIFALACGEPGIVPYLKPSQGDIALEIYGPDDFLAALDFALSKGDMFKSIVIDNVNLLWDSVLEDKEDSLGREIRGQDWRSIKGPWKSWLRKIMRSGQNVVLTAWQKDVLYTQEEGMPGQQGKTVILAQDNPQVEKTIPYTVDLIFKTDVQRDAKFRPTNIHTLTFTGGRRPVTIPPEELFTGKVWKFDSKKPVNVWDSVIKPLDERWMEGAVDHLGLDPQEAEQVHGEVSEAWQMQETARLMEEIAKCQPAEAKDKWERDWGKVYVELTAERRALVDEAKAKAKARWTGGK